MKVCVVGLDGATWDLLDPWLGDLPTIRRFADTVRGDLRSCTPPVSIPAWKCYSTGMDPGDLGVFTFVEPDFDQQRLKTVRSESFTHREIWDYLGEADYRSAAINVPGTSPPRGIDGWMVSGPFSEPDDFATPRETQESLISEEYDIIPDYYISRDPEELDDAATSVRQKFDTALRFSAQADFVHLTIYTTDTVQHTEWDSPASKGFWTDVDQELGRFIEQLGDEWNVVLMSDHGFGESAGIFYLNTWLEEQGYMKIDRSGFDLGDVAGALGLEYASVKMLVRKLRLERPLRTLLPSDVIIRLARQLPGNRKLEGMQNRIDWESDAIALAPLIYTKDRATADEIRDKLLSVTDRHGHHVIQEVYYGEDLYPYCDVRVPDLIIAHGEYVISDVENDQVFAYDREWPEHKIAHHRMDGILAAQGPDVEDVTLDDARLYDLVPTILDGFGVTIPTAMRGESLRLLGSRSHCRNVPVRRNTSRVVEHDENVEQKLKDLGYL